MNEIRTAVIGVGHQGRWHAEKYVALEGSILKAVVDVDAERSRGLAAELGVEALGNVEEIIGKVDAVTVATPSPAHFEIVKTLLENGIHVLVEKPITETVEEARALVKLAEDKGLVLQVGHLERFNPAVVALASHIDRPQFIESNRIAPFKARSLDVSVVLDLMIHDIDLIHSFVQSPMTDLDAIGRPVFSSSIDVANARIKFDNGCVANVNSSRFSLKTERSIRVFQPDSYLSADMHNKTLTLFRKKNHDGPVTKPEDVAVDKQSFDDCDALLAQSRAFLDAVAGGPPPLVSGRTAMQALETAIAINTMVGKT